MAVTLSKIEYSEDTWTDLFNKFNNVIDALEQDFVRGGSTGDTILFQSIGGVGGNLEFASNTTFVAGTVTDFSTPNSLRIMGSNTTHYILSANTSTNRLRYMSLGDFSGTGSGFDADLLDGHHGEWYANTENFTGTFKNENFPTILPEISGQNLSNLNATSIKTGTLDDARIPEKMAGKIFSTGVTVDFTNPFLTLKNGSVQSRFQQEGNNLKISYTNASNATTEMINFNPVNKTATLFGRNIFTADNITPVDAVTNTQISSRIIANTPIAGMYGSFNSSQIQNIFTANNSHTFASNGTGFGSASGLALYNSSMGLGTFASGIQMVFVSAGTVRSALGTNIWTSGDITGFSDARVKTNFEKIPNPLDKIAQLNGYTFDRIDTGVRQMGVVAQELLPVIPEVVHGDEDGYYSVAYDKLTALLIEGVKELREENIKLREEISKLKGE